MYLCLSVLVGFSGESNQFSQKPKTLLNRYLILSMITKMIYSFLAVIILIILIEAFKN